VNIKSNQLGSKHPAPAGRLANSRRGLRWYRQLWAPLVWFCAGFGALTASSGECGEDLRELVGADVGLCIELNQLENQAAALQDGLLVKRFRAWPVYRKWLVSEDYKRFSRGLQLVRSLAGKSAWQVAKELFGRQAILAVYRTDRDQPSGVLLTTLPSGEELDALLDVISRMDPRSTQSRTYRGVDYQCRLKPDSDSADAPQFYLRLGNQVAFSDNEPAIQRVIDLHVLRSDGGGELRSLLQQPLYASTAGGLRDQSLLSVFVNLRIWSDAQRPGNPVWDSVDAVFAGLRVTDSIVVEAVGQLAKDPVPHWSAFCRQVSGAPEFLALAPRSALVVAAGRLPGPFLATAIAALVQDHPNRDLQTLRSLASGLLLQWDPIRGVLPSLGPNWGAYILPAAPGAGWPVTGVAAVQLAQSEPLHDQLPALQTALDNALLTGLRFVGTTRQSRESKPKLEREIGDGTTVRWLQGLSELTPAYALRSDRLVLGGDTSHVRRAISETPRDSAADDLPRTVLTDFGQVLYINVAGIRQLISTDGERLSAMLRVPQGSDEVHRRQRLVEALELLDAAFVGVHCQPETVRILFGAVFGPAPAGD